MMRWLGVRSGERRLVGWLTALFAVMQASHGLGANAADALFFLRFGVGSLPLMILLAGPAVMVFTLAHGAGLASRRTDRWLPLASMIVVGWIIGEWFLAAFGGRFAYPVIWLSTQVILTVTYTVMWNAAGASCTTRQAKRLYPLFATAGIAGGVVGNLVTGPLAHWLGTQNLLLVQGGLVLGASLILKGATPMFGAEATDGPPHPVSELGRLFRFVIGNPFTRIASLTALAVAALFYFVYFPFSQAAAEAFSSEAEVAGFLGLFSSVATVLTFLVSLFLTNRLFARLGLVVSLMIVPAVYAGGFLLWFGSFSLMTATLVRGLQWVAVNAIGGTGFTALFNVMTGRRRSQIVAFMTAIPMQIGAATAGLVLIVAQAWSPRVIFFIGLIVAVGCLLLVIRLRSAYLDALVAAVRQGIVGILDSPAQTLFIPDDADARRILESALEDDRPQARAVAVAGLARIGDPAVADQIERLLSDPDPKVRSVAFASVCAVAPDRVATYASTALGDESPEVRLQVVRYLGGIDAETGRGLAAQALDDSNPTVRAAAATVVGGSEGHQRLKALLDEDPISVEAALTEIATRRQSPPDIDVTRFLDHPRAGIRRWAATTHVRLGGSPARLRPLLEDRSPQVRRSAAEALAATESGRRTLIQVLSSGSVVASEAALQALTPMSELTEDFVAWAVSEVKRAAHLESAAQALGNMRQSPAGDYLIRVLRMRVDRLVQWVLLAVTTETTKSMMQIVARGIRSTHEETRSQAIEAVETLAVREVSAVLLPLIESDGAGAVRDPQRVLDELTDDFDPWISALARAAGAGPPEDSAFVASLPLMQSEETPETLGSMERVLALQRVRMFSELDPEDLERVASATRETRYQPGELVFEEGASGDEMLLIVDGEVEVSITNGPSRLHIGSYGVGEPVGELALLTGGTRSADVHAGDAGAHGLLLSGTDLTSVLEERPEVALRMLATLAERLARQASERDRTSR